MVGSNGLEPSTSRLSGARSNHLSYEPICVFRLKTALPYGDEGNRTPDPLLAGQVLSQLSYTPVFSGTSSRFSLRGFLSEFSFFEVSLDPSKLNNKSLSTDLVHLFRVLLLNEPFPITMRSHPIGSFSIERR